MILIRKDKYHRHKRDKASHNSKLLKGGFVMKVLDCKGLACPKPVILTKKELENMESGEIEVIVDNDTAVANVSKFAKSIGAEAVVKCNEGISHIIIKKEKNLPLDDNINSMNFRPMENLVLLVGNDKLGNGDDKLGAVLMKSYMFALAESDKKPHTILFLNGGVKLTTEGSDVLESLKLLEAAGTEIMSCGTCLDFYGVKDKLTIGSVTNMYTIVEKMNGASNTIKL